MSHSIFIVDDNREILELAECNLKHIQNTTLLTFTNPQTALKKIEAHGAPDLIITDLNMKQMSGIEFITRLRVFDIPNIIIFTGDAAALPPSCHYHTVFKDAGGFEKLAGKVEELLLAVPEKK